MDQLMTREESYAERRQLFKDIWKTSMNMDDREDILTKPKVIKTLRLNEVDRCVAKKKKRQKLKNLRAVCNKLLDFCDRQDADDLFYEQVAAGKKSLTCLDPPVEPIHPPTKKKKPLQVKKKMRTTKSLFVPDADTALTRATTSERKRPLPLKVSRHTSPIKVKRTSVSFATNKTLKSNPPPRISTKNVNSAFRDSGMPHPTVVKKKRSKKKPSNLKMLTGIAYDELQ